VETNRGFGEVALSRHDSFFFLDRMIRITDDGDRIRHGQGNRITDDDGRMSWDVVLNLE